MLQQNCAVSHGSGYAEYQSQPAVSQISFDDKKTLEYSNIGINKLESMVRAPNCPFVLLVGTKKLVKRKEFEEFIRRKVVI